MIDLYFVMIDLYFVRIDLHIGSNLPKVWENPHTDRGLINSPLFLDRFPTVCVWRTAAQLWDPLFGARHE